MTHRRRISAGFARFDPRSSHCRRITGYAATLVAAPCAHIHERNRTRQRGKTEGIQSDICLTAPFARFSLAPIRRSRSDLCDNV